MTSRLVGSFCLVLFAGAVSSLAFGGDASVVRQVVAHDGSVYAFVAQVTDFEAARDFCRRFEWPGKARDGTPQTVRGFDILTIDSVAERDWVHGRVYARQGGLEQYTWAGVLAYRGAPRPIEGQQYIFGVWNDPRGLVPWPQDWGAAFVCEARTKTTPSPVFSSTVAGANAGVIRDDTMLYRGHLYVFTTRGRTYQEAIAFCNGLERRFEGARYPSFQMVRLDDLAEQKRVHELIQKNGGAWTWAGVVTHPQAPAPVSGYRPVFTQWDRADVLTLQPEQNKYSVVCESVGGGPTNGKRDRKPVNP